MRTLPAGFYHDQLKIKIVVDEFIAQRWQAPVSISWSGYARLPAPIGFLLQSINC